MSHGQHPSHASVGERSRETVVPGAEPCDLPETNLGKRSREAVHSNAEVFHGQHTSHVSVGECSRETVVPDVEP
eukprot:3656563-Amphidinium_carterae.1